MNRATLCLGANIPNADQNIERALEVIEQHAHIISSTPPYPTAPEHAGDAPPYTNRIVIIETAATLDRFHQAMKSYETQIRSTAEALPLVALDIDIVVWNNSVLRPADAQSQYFQAGIKMLNY